MSNNSTIRLCEWYREGKQSAQRSPEKLSVSHISYIKCNSQRRVRCLTPAVLFLCLSYSMSVMRLTIKACLARSKIERCVNSVFPGWLAVCKMYLWKCEVMFSGGLLLDRLNVGRKTVRKERCRVSGISKDKLSITAVTLNKHNPGRLADGQTTTEESILGLLLN